MKIDRVRWGQTRFCDFIPDPSLLGLSNYFIHQTESKKKNQKKEDGLMRNKLIESRCCIKAE